jgi:hypothetical protein
LLRLAFPSSHPPPQLPNPDHPNRNVVPSARAAGSPGERDGLLARYRVWEWAEWRDPRGRRSCLGWMRRRSFDARFVSSPCSAAFAQRTRRGSFRKVWTVAESRLGCLHCAQRSLLTEKSKGTSSFRTSVKASVSGRERLMALSGISIAPLHIVHPL